MLPSAPLSPSAHLLRAKVSPALLAALLALGLVACQPENGGGEGGGATEDTSSPPVVEVTAVDYAYRNVPDSIPAGWTTLRLHNEGQETHMLEFARLPEGIAPQDWREVIATYRELLPKLRAGEIDTTRLEERLPRWAPDSIDGVGGLGPLGSGRTASITTRLEPGTHVMTCYVSTPEETNHWEIGMDRAFTVTSDSTGADPPEADLDLRLSGYEINSDGELKAGEQTVAVHSGERPNSDEPPFQTIELARIPGGVSVDSVAAWPNSLQAPAPTDFLGGMVSMDAGKTAYLTVDVSPGRYAWVSHASKEKGMRKTFTVE